MKENGSGSDGTLIVHRVILCPHPRRRIFIEVNMTTQILKSLPMLCIATALAVPLAAAAQNGPPPGVPMSEMAAKMGVTEAALENCMPRPEPGARPERPDPAAIASCLKVDAETVAAVLKAGAPDTARRSN